MKRLILITLTLFSTIVTSFAQDEPPLYEDFLKGVKDVKTFALNDHLNILQVNLDNENFDLIAVNDKMQIVWRNTFTGFALGADKFKDKIVAVASTDHGFFKGSNNIFKAYLVDPATGKTLVEKVVYAGNNDYMCYSQMSTGDGAFLKIIVRQSALKRKLHVGLPGPLILFTLNKLDKEYNQTLDLQVLDLDEKLEPINSFKPAISNGSYISTTWNKKGDMFIGWFNGPSVEVYKYQSGKTAPTAQLTTTMAFDEDKTAHLGGIVHFMPAENSDMLYYSVLYRNPDKDTELGIGSLNFATNKKQYVYEVMDKDALKEIKKAFVPVTKKLDDVDLGPARDLHVRFMSEHNGRIVLGMSSLWTQSSSISSGFYELESSLIITGYDLNLKNVFRNVLPSSYAVPERVLQTGFSLLKNKLYVVANNKSGMRTLRGMYGQLDLKTGEWDKMDLLSKKHIGSSDFVDGTTILWFGNGFIVPYFDPAGLSGMKYNITLQQNEY